MVQVLLKVIGRGTRAIADMDVGQKIDVLGPFGRGFEVGSNCNHYLVGGGIGIAPLLFLSKKY
jgi:dihydroorotate dehydrogenase electron transfer subunit